MMKILEWVITASLAGLFAAYFLDLFERRKKRREIANEIYQNYYWKFWNVINSNSEVDIDYINNFLDKNFLILSAGYKNLYPLAIDIVYMISDCNAYISKNQTIPYSIDKLASILKAYKFRLLDTMGISEKDTYGKYADLKTPRPIGPSRIRSPF